jgi:hypothetical protein
MQSLGRGALVDPVGHLLDRVLVDLVSASMKNPEKRASGLEATL